MPDWSAIREQFPSLSRWTYLNSATYGQTPRFAVEAMNRYMARRDEFACADFLSWYDDMDRIRESCATLIHAAPDDIAFVPNAALGLSFLMQGLDWNPGDEVLTLDDEFPNQLYQSALQTRFQICCKAVPWERFYESVNPRTRVVVISTVNYATGFRPPIPAIAKFLKERGVIFYADGTQSVGALRFDVREAPVSMLCVDAYKWLLSPNGAGFVYVDPDLRRRLSPTVLGWRSDRGWRDVNQLNHGIPIFAEAAERFEGGALALVCLYAMETVIDFELAIGTDVIESRVLELAGMVRTMLASAGAEVNLDQSQIVTARFPGRDPAEMAAALRRRNILVTARHGRMRVAPHFYNTEADIERLRDGLPEKGV
jgi:cysteine desulfurase/selenocysteine lyase